MKALIYAPQMARYGGMEQHVCLLAALLAGNGHAVTVLTTSNSLNQDARAELIKAGIELRELAIERGAASKMRKLGWLLLQALRLRSCQWDVVYTNGQSALARLVWLAKGKGCRIIHHHHTGGDCGEQLTWNKSFRRMLVRVPELVACSETTRRHLEAVLKRTDITYLPYLTIESVTINQVLERKYLDKATLNFGFIGRLVSSKGIETLCALSQEPALAQVQWHVHGSGEHYPQSFFDRYPNVRYHGPFSGSSDCATVLSRLDAVALFSRHNEGMPLSLIEAMSAGLPWIATDQGGTQEMAVAAENCEIIPSAATFEDVRDRTIRMVARIRSGATSRVSQRRVYDAYFGSAVASKCWIEYMRCERNR